MLNIEEVDYDTVPFTVEEVQAKMDSILNSHPRMEPRLAQNTSIRRLKHKYGLLASGEIGEVADGSNSGDV